MKGITVNASCWHRRTDGHRHETEAMVCLTAEDNASNMGVGQGKLIIVLAMLFGNNVVRTMIAML